VILSNQPLDIVLKKKKNTRKEDREKQVKGGQII